MFTYAISQSRDAFYLADEVAAANLLCVELICFVFFNQIGNSLTSLLAVMQTTRAESLACILLVK